MAAGLFDVAVGAAVGGSGVLVGGTFVAVGAFWVRFATKVWTACVWAAPRVG